MSAPKVMVSHASEDKERFVVEFATQLRGAGIDAWLDQWEISPGDSLVQRIFDEGIGKADVFLVVLSRASVNKRWVKEELDAAVVRRIQGSCRLIPVVLDECEIPSSLRHLLWVRIKSVDSYEKEFRQIVRAIFGRDEKPPLGSAPDRVEVAALDFIPEASQQDNIVFDAIGKAYLESGQVALGLGQFAPRLQAAGLSEEEIQESLEALAELHIMKGDRSGFGFIIARPSFYALDDYVRRVVDDYDGLVSEIAGLIVNEGMKTSEDLEEATGQPAPLVRHVLKSMSDRNLISVVTSAGMLMWITKVGVKLKRSLQ